MPRVTVLMPVYNASQYLGEAIDSILNQTYTDFEFIIVNDGSMDDTSKILDLYDDPRMRIVNLETNKGIVNALNVGIEAADGEFIVRMDADDISVPERIKKQVSFMDDNPKIGLAGSWVKYFGYRKGVIKTPQFHNQIIWELVVDSSIFHPSVIIRSSILRNFNIRYSSIFPHAEDYALWVEVATLSKLANIQEALLHYRFSEGSLSSKNYFIQKQSASWVAKSLYEKLLKRSLNEKEWTCLNPNESLEFNIPIFISINKELEKKIALRIKQFALKKKPDTKSLFWLLRNSVVHPAFLKYFCLGLFKQMGTK
jgi:glycosyltransferase involved in cell wall biosynthesis